MKVEELNIYPLKSGRGQKIPRMQMTAQGPDGDRMWMLIDENGKFISQRTLPKLATIEVFHEAEALTMGFQKMFFKITKKNSFARKVTVTVWNETFEAALEPDLYSQGISQYLGMPCRLVRFAPYSERKVKSTQSDWAPGLRFADGRPLLLTNLKSLADLNSKLERPVGMDRFRSNIVIDTDEAFIEDAWKRIKIGPVLFSQPKKCSRCKIINIDQQTGISDGVEPLKTLASYRRQGSSVVFGALWIPENEGIISVHDPIEVLE